MDKKLQVDLRQTKPKSILSEIRRRGRIPAVVYGTGESLAISVSEREFSQTFHTVSENTIVELIIGSKKKSVLVKNFQRNPINDVIVHIDFLEIRKDKEVRTHIPIHLEGSSIGVREGGILERHLHDIEISCLPRHLPENISVDITDLKIGDSLHVGDISFSDNLKIISGSENIVILVSAPKQVQEVQEEELLDEVEQEGESTDV